VWRITPPRGLAQRQVGPPVVRVATTLAGAVCSPWRSAAATAVEIRDVWTCRANGVATVSIVFALQTRIAITADRARPITTHPPIGPQKTPSLKNRQPVAHPRAHPSTSVPRPSEAATCATVPAGIRPRTNAKWPSVPT